MGTARGQEHQCRIPRRILESQTALRTKTDDAIPPGIGRAQTGDSGLTSRLTAKIFMESVVDYRPRFCTSLNSRVMALPFGTRLASLARPCA
jgi:hypothetical protein